MTHDSNMSFGPGAVDNPLGPRLRFEGGNRTNAEVGNSSQLPEGPLDEQVQEGLIKEFQKRQDAQEIFFSSGLVIVSLPLFLFFVYHAYLHLIDPW